jgi:two-component system, OmpR family, response regulator
MRGAFIEVHSEFVAGKFYPLGSRGISPLGVTLMRELRALIVDDEIDYLETLVNRLKRRNIDAQGVESGNKALELLGREEFDVVVLDVRMPGIDGIQTLREVKERKPLVEVILLTGHGSVESGIQGMRLGAFDYVMKPVDIDELLEKITQAHERKLINEG